MKKSRNEEQHHLTVNQRVILIPSMGQIVSAALRIGWLEWSGEKMKNTGRKNLLIRLALTLGILASLSFSHPPKLVPNRLNLKTPQVDSVSGIIENRPQIRFNVAPILNARSMSYADKKSLVNTIDQETQFRIYYEGLVCRDGYTLSVIGKEDTVFILHKEKTNKCIRAGRSYGVRGNLFGMDSTVKVIAVKIIKDGYEPSLSGPLMEIKWKKNESP